MNENRETQESLRSQLSTLLTLMTQQALESPLTQVEPNPKEEYEVTIHESDEELNEELTMDEILAKYGKKLGNPFDFF